MNTSSTKNSLIIGISIVLGASLLSVGVSNAAGSTIKACAKKSNGAMRLIDAKKKCTKSERTLSWGMRGATGSSGTSGISYATYTESSLTGVLSGDPAQYRVASLDNLVAGDYLVQATLQMDVITSMVGIIACRFDIGMQQNGRILSPYGYLNFDSNDREQSATVTHAVENLPGGDYDKIDLQCDVRGVGDVYITNLTMAATRVDTLERQN